MNYSGVLVMAKPSNLQVARDALNALAGVEVFQIDRERGRIVAVLEADSIKAETELLQCIKSLPGVAAAEMVYHYFEDDNEVITHIPEELDKLQGLGAVPEALRDN